jgi:hypothetical protein
VDVVLVVELFILTVVNGKMMFVMASVKKTVGKKEGCGVVSAVEM